MAAALRHACNHRPRVGHAGQPRLAEQADILAFLYGIQIVAYLLGRRMFVEFEEDGVVDGVGIARPLEEAACRAQLLDEDGVARGQKLQVIGG